jgi:hypothetical protein
MIHDATDAEPNVIRRHGVARLALYSAQWQPYWSTIHEEQT